MHIAGGTVVCNWHDYQKVYNEALNAFMQSLKSQTLKDILPAEPT
jgi:hypothetical protein